MSMIGSLDTMNFPPCSKCGGEMKSFHGEYRCTECGHIHFIKTNKVERTHEYLGPKLPRSHEPTPWSVDMDPSY